MPKVIKKQEMEPREGLVGIWPWFSSPSALRKGHPCPHRAQGRARAEGGGHGSQGSESCLYCCSERRGVYSF